MLNHEHLAKITVEELVKDDELLEFAREMVAHHVVIDINAMTKKITVTATRKNPLGIEYKHQATAEI